MTAPRFAIGWDTLEITPNRQVSAGYAAIIAPEYLTVRNATSKGNSYIPRAAFPELARLLLSQLSPDEYRAVVEPK